jgi:hypothetical protein
MNIHKNSRYPSFVLLASLLFLLLTACQPGVSVTGPQPTQLPPSTETPAVQPTPTQPLNDTPADIILDYSAVAQSVTAETVEAVSAGAGGGANEVMPQYRRLTLEGYPTSNPIYQPQIFIFPAGELAAANQTAGKTAADLETLLQTQQAGEQMPFLPLAFSSIQAMDAQVQYLDFKNGKGVRFLTQFNNGMAPINNAGLIYTFQGLTSDGKYYVSAVLPVTSPELSADTAFSEQEAKAGPEYRDYLTKTVAMLNQQPAGTFTPDLAKLDALIQSIEVR